MMHGDAFNSDHTIGETKALLAPVFNTTSENIDNYLLVYVGRALDGAPAMGMVSNDPHPECKIGMMAKLIELVAAEMASGNTDG